MNRLSHNRDVIPSFMYRKPGQILRQQYDSKWSIFNNETISIDEEMYDDFSKYELIINHYSDNDDIKSIKITYDRKENSGIYICYVFDYERDSGIGKEKYMSVFPSSLSLDDEYNIDNDYNYAEILFDISTFRDEIKYIIDSFFKLDIEKFYIILFEKDTTPIINLVKSITNNS